MIVAGGTYLETCLSPPSQYLLGSAGRAAFALVGRGSIELDTFYPPRVADDVVANFAPLGVKVRVHPSPAVVEFHYLYPLSSPRIFPVPLPRSAPVRVSGDAVLRFGCLEGSFVVDAPAVVFDPQSGVAPEVFSANGSKAGRLAVVCNVGEARASSGLLDTAEAAAAIMSRDGAEVVVIKNGPSGAWGFERGGEQWSVPAYAASGANKIGSGDVFSAIFAHLWCEAGRSPREAADTASRHAAHYVGTRGLPCPDILPAMEPREMRRDLKALVVGRADSTAGAWLLDELAAGLRQFGATVRSVRLEAGADGAGPADGGVCVDDWDRGDVVLALVGGGDSAALAAARAAVTRGKPTVAFAQGRDAVAEAGRIGCIVEHDPAAAVYRAVWSGA